LGFNTPVIALHPQGTTAFLAKKRNGLLDGIRAEAAKSLSIILANNSNFPDEASLWRRTIRRITSDREVSVQIELPLAENPNNQRRLNEAMVDAFNELVRRADGTPYQPTFGERERPNHDGPTNDTFLSVGEVRDDGGLYRGLDDSYGSKQPFRPHPPGGTANLGPRLNI
jgi:hypothetical protein